MAITVTGKFKAISAEAAERLAASISAEGANVKCTQDGLNFTVAREFENEEALKAYNESEAIAAQKKLADELVEGGAEGVSVEMS